MANKTKIYVNERPWTVDAAPETPLLYVLSNELQLKGPVLAVAWRNADRVRF
jgi:aerobic-type carbon monoxide dehydrogenase small subunit (CoxS/CutS family)